jgi:hypothetical protein
VRIGLDSNIAIENEIASPDHVDSGPRAAELLSRLKT